MSSIVHAVDGKKSVLLLDNFRCEQDRIVNSIVYWKCKDSPCAGRNIQHRSNLSNVKKQYSHGGNEIKSKAKEIKMNLKRQIEDSLEEVKRTYRENIILLYNYVYRMFSLKKPFISSE